MLRVAQDATRYRPIREEIRRGSRPSTHFRSRSESELTAVNIGGRRSHIIPQMVGIVTRTAARRLAERQATGIGVGIGSRLVPTYRSGTRND